MKKKEIEIFNLDDCNYELLEILEKDDIIHDTMDIEVENTHYYTLKNGIISHNSLAIEAKTTSGIEPVFKIRSLRRRKINPNEENIKVDFVDENGDSWEEYNVFHYEFLNWFKLTEPTLKDTPISEIQSLLQELDENKLDAIITESPWAGSESHDIDYMEKVKMQGVIQKWIDHSISVCLVKDTLIDTDKGLFYLDELSNFKSLEVGKFRKNKENNSKILNHQNKRVKISSFYNNGIKPVIKIELNNGLFIKSTLNERYQKLNDDTGEVLWVEAHNLKLGDRIKLKNNIDH